MHTWLSWSPSNHVEAPLQSSKAPYPHCLSMDWRNDHQSLATPIPSMASQSDLLIAAAVADNLAALDLLMSTEDKDLDPWWRVAPGTHLLDELPDSTPSDNTFAQTKQDIAMEIMRLDKCVPHHQHR